MWTRITCLSVFAFSTVAAAQTGDAKAALDALKARKPQDNAAIQSRVDKLNQLDAAALEAEVKSLRALHAANLENWKKLQSTRPAEKPVEVRAANYALQLWKWDKTREAKLQDLQNQEALAFQKAYKEPFSERSKHYKAWKESAEGLAHYAEYVKFRNAHMEAHARLYNEVRHGNVASQETLDELHRALLDEYQATAKAVRAASEALAKRTATPKPTPPAAEPPKSAAPPKPAVANVPAALPAGAVPYIVTCRIKLDGSEPETIETSDFFELTVEVGNGKPPFQLTVRTSEGEVKTATLTEPGERSFPFVFRSVGSPHRIAFSAIDANGATSKTASFAVEVRLPNRGSPKDPPATAPATKPATLPTTPTAPSPPVLQSFAGPCSALFWCSDILDAPPGFAGRTGDRVHPVPVSITFDSTGNFTGRCDYSAPPGLFDPAHRKKYDTSEWKAQFTMSGKVDWQTGLMTISIPDLRISSLDQSEDSRLEKVKELSASIQGRHTADPHWARYCLLAGGVPDHPGKVPLEDMERAGYPNLVQPVTGGVWRMADYGWFRNFQDNAGLAAPVAAVKKAVVIQSGFTSDDTASAQQSLQNALKANGVKWYLKIVGPETAASDLTRLELVGTTIWPERSVTVKPNENVFVQFVGVMSDNFTSARDLNGVCEWVVPPGLTQVGPGVFRAATPGKYEVKARAKGRSGVWMEGFVAILVE